MRRHSVLLGAVLAAALTLPLTSDAQRPVTFGLAGGFTPTRASDPGGVTYGGGAHAQLSLERARVLGRLGVRIDVFAHAFDRPTFGAVASGRENLPGASVSVVLPLTGQVARFQGYLLAGSGTYRSDLGQSNREWHHGLSAGGGVEWRRGRTRPFVESRVIKVYDGPSPRLVPITVGVRF